MIRSFHQTLSSGQNKPRKKHFLVQISAFSPLSSAQHSGDFTVPGKCKHHHSKEHFLPFTHLGEVRQLVPSWRRQRWDPGAGRPPLNLCHQRCWRSCKSHKWRQNNTGHTGFGQMLYRRDSPVETNIGKFHIFVYFVLNFGSVATVFCFSCTGLSDRSASPMLCTLTIP